MLRTPGLNNQKFPDLNKVERYLKSDSTRVAGPLSEPVVVKVLNQEFAAVKIIAIEDKEGGEIETDKETGGFATETLKKKPKIQFHGLQLSVLKDFSVDKQVRNEKLDQPL